VTLKHDPCLDHWHPGPRSCAIKPHPSIEGRWIVELWVSDGDTRLAETFGLQGGFTVDEAWKVSDRLLKPAAESPLPPASDAPASPGSP
jgi:hypothetical protein